jgi:exodeoxyribonuclease-1
MLDVVRLTRALRPEGIEWPVVEGMPTNKLELISDANGLDHKNAHDALSDVEALIGVTKLVHDKQPKLFEYLLGMRDKNAVKKLVNLEAPQPFVYASGRYDSNHNKTTVAYPLAAADFGNVFVYDLRYDPNEWVKKSAAELEKIVTTPYKDRDESYQKLPVKKLQYNRVPAVAPIGVLSQNDGWKKLELELETVEKHRNILLQHPDFAKKCAEILLKRPDYPPLPYAEGKLYDGFVSDKDKLRAEVVRNATPEELAKYKPDFNDARLKEMFVRYKARNFPRTLVGDERAAYEAWRAEHLQKAAPGFVKELDVMSRKTDLTDHQQYILEELKLWLERVMPETD